MGVHCLMKHIRVMVIGVVTLCMCTGCQTLAPTKGESTRRAVGWHEQLGNVYFEKGRVKAALHEWKLAVELDPANTTCRERIKALESGTPIVLQEPPAMPAESASGVQQRIEQELQRARNCYQASKLKDAEIAWQHVLRMDLENSQAKAGLAQLNAEEYQSRADQEYDVLIQDYYEKGMVFFRQGEWKPAEAALANASKLAPDQEQISNYLQQTREALAVEQKQVLVKQLRMEILSEEQNQQWPAVHALWKKILELEPDAVDAPAGLLRAQQGMNQAAEELVRGGKSDMQAGRYTEAIKKFKKALEFNPDSAEANGGIVAIRKRFTREEEKTFNRGEAKKCFEQGVLYSREGAWDNAAREWEKAVQLDPERVEYQTWLERARLEAGKKQTKNEQLAKNRYQDGLQAFQREDLEAATMAFKEVVELAPSAPEAEKAQKHIAKIRELQK